MADRLYRDPVQEALDLIRLRDFSAANPPPTEAEIAAQRERDTMASIYDNVGPVLQYPVNAVRLGVPALAGGAYEALKSGFMYPGQVLYGELPPPDITMQTDPEATIGKLMDVASIPAAGMLPRVAGRMDPNTLSIFAGREAKTADRIALAKAREMEFYGDPPDKIWRETGWGKGADGEWRFEIDDSNMKLQPLGDGSYVIDHQKFEEAYPGLLAAMKQDIRPQPATSNMQGYWEDATKTLQARGTTMEDLREVALHELQHAAQSAERFAAGTAPSSNDVARRRQMIPTSEITAARNAAQADLSRLDDQIKQHYNDNRTIYEPEWSKLDRSSQIRIINELLQGPLKDQRKDYVRAYDIMNNGPTSPYSTTGLYRREAGEAEARNAAYRADYPEDLRRLWSPFQTQDVPTDQQWVAPRRSKLAWNEDGTPNPLGEALEVVRSESVGPTYRIGDELAPAGSGYTAVPGKPSTVDIPGVGKVEARPIRPLTDTADAYMRSVGRPGEHDIKAFPAFDEDRARRIAEQFALMKHDPSDPRVRRSYDAMIDETLAQYRSLKDAGIDFRFMKDGDTDPYALSPALGYADIVKNGRLTVFPTDFGFGTSAAFDPATNPLLKGVGKIGDKPNAVANDAFRVVHDAYGHFAPGNPFFRHQGEERAWAAHSRMYSPDAQPAMTSETRGQNSWLNFGPHGEANRRALGADTVFADQKTGIMDPWTWTEGKFAEGGGVPVRPGALTAEEEALAVARKPVAARAVSRAAAAESMPAARAAALDELTPRPMAPIEEALSLTAKPPRAAAAARITEEPPTMPAPVRLAEAPAPQPMPELAPPLRLPAKVERPMPAAVAEPPVPGGAPIEAPVPVAKSSRPEWFEAGKPVDMMSPRFANQADFLEPEEFDYDWRLTKIPSNVLRPFAKQNMEEFKKSVEARGVNDAEERILSINGWIDNKGSADEALKEAPLVAILVDGNLELVDGHHRNAVLQHANAAENGLWAVVGTPKTIGQTAPSGENFLNASATVQSDVVDSAAPAPADQGAAATAPKDYPEPEAFDRPKGNDGARVSTRMPTGKRITFDPHSPDLRIDTEAQKLDRAQFEKHADLLRQYPNVTEAQAKMPADDMIKAYQDHVVDNLLWLHDAVPPKLRERMKRWYDGARNIVDRWVDEFGGRYTDAQIAGVLAVMSPQKDWYMNVALARRIIDIHTNMRDQGWTPEMSQTTDRIFGDPKFDPLKVIRGKAYGELSDPIQRAAWVRVFSEAHHDPAFPIITPEGQEGDPVKTGSGSNYKIAWSPLTTIAKALACLDSADLSTISAQLGAKHKVRSFYNNIVAPQSTGGEVTMDTHAVAAAQLRPHGGSAPEVAHNLGSSHTVKGVGNATGSAVTGVEGTYGIHADAYREAARRRGILPREMQSITWEAVRGLFSAAFKRNKKAAAAIDEVWKDFRRGRLTADAARSKVLELAGGIDEPTWISGRNLEDVEGGGPSGDAGELDPAELDGAASEASNRRGRGAPAARTPARAAGGRVDVTDYLAQRALAARRGYGGRVTAPRVFSMPQIPDVRSGLDRDPLTAALAVSKR